MCKYVRFGVLPVVSMTHFYRGFSKMYESTYNIMFSIFRYHVRNKRSVFVTILQIPNN
jgi:hypothetical protein